MKLLLILLGMAAAGVLGYVSEKKIRPNITLSGDHLETAKSLTAASKNHSAINLSNLSADQLPASVTLKSEVKTADLTSGITMTIAAGTRVKLLQIENQMAIISPGETNLQLKLPIHECDLLEQLAAKHPQNSNLIESAPSPSGDTQESTPAPETSPMPAQRTEIAPTPKPVQTNKTDAVKIMQESIRAGQIKEFTLDQVIDWKAEADETMDGKVFQTGIATYKAETIFGVKTIQAKALIQNGKVHVWVWPKSGVEIK